MSNTSKSLQTIIDPSTGELMEINLDGLVGLSQAETGALRKLSDVGSEPIMIVHIDWSEGKRQGIEGKRCAVIGYLQPTVDRDFHGAYSFSEGVTATLTRAEANGKGTSARPLTGKVTKDGPTSNGYYVDKLEPLTPAEERKLREAFIR